MTDPARPTVTPRVTHPAIDDHEAASLRAELTGTEPVVASAGPVERKGRPTARLREAARHAAAPMVARLRKELVAASAGDQADVREQVATLRAELARTRAEHAAELAALHEELAATRAATDPAR